MLGALLHGGALIGGFLNDYISVFYFFFFTLKRYLNMYNLLESLSAYFKKAPINPVYPNLNITI